MNTAIEKATPNRDRERTQAESEMLKDIVRRNWHGKLEIIDKSGTKNLAAEMEGHILNMSDLVDALDYEVFCVPNIISHSKHMSKEDFGKYLKLMEAMAEGYSAMFGRDIAGLALIGISSKAKNVNGVERYHKLLASHIESRANRYHSSIEKGKKRMDGIYLRMRSYERGLLRFFMRGKRDRLARRIDRGLERMYQLNSRYDRLNSIYRKVIVRGGRHRN